MDCILNIETGPIYQRKGFGINTKWFCSLVMQHEKMVEIVWNGREITGIYDTWICYLTFFAFLMTMKITEIFNFFITTVKRPSPSSRPATVAKIKLLDFLYACVGPLPPSQDTSSSKRTVLSVTMETSAPSA